MEETKGGTEEPLTASEGPLAFTVELLRVQAGVYDRRLGQDLQDAIAAWQEARTSKTACVAARYLWSAWAADSAVPTAVQLPPPHASTDVERIVNPHVKGLVTARSGSTGNIVVAGVPGVGTTTVLKVCCILHALRCRDYVVVYWDYGGTRVDDEEAKLTAGTSYFPPGPCQVLHHVLRWAAGDRRDCPGPLQHVFGARFGAQYDTLAGVYCDEVSHFYTPASAQLPPEHPRVVWGRHCAQSLVNLGKGSCSTVMCTGSATQLPSMIFPQRDGPYGLFPSLNHTVFFLRRLHPLRSRQAVAAFVDARYGLALDEGVARDLFSVTGGIRRRIHEWHSSNQDLEAARRVAVAATLAALEQRTHPLHTSVMAFAGALYSRHADDVGDSERQGAACLGVPCATILRTGLSVQEVLQLQEEGIVFHNVETRQYEFAIPACGDAAVDFFRRDGDARALHGMRTCLTGWGRGSAGAAAEPLVLRHMLPHDRAPLRLVAREGVVYVQCGDTCTLLRDFSIAQLCDRAVCVGNDTGASAFVISATSPRRCEVHGVRIELGGVLAHFTPGVLKAQRGRGSYTAHDRSCIAGVVASLEVAWRAFRAVLRAAYPRTSFRLTGASLLSNKVVNVTRLPPSHLRVRTGERQCKIGPRVSCPLTLVCGTDFYDKLPAHIVRCVLPSEHAKLVRVRSSLSTP